MEKNSKNSRYISIQKLNMILPQTNVEFCIFMRRGVHHVKSPMKTLPQTQVKYPKMRWY